MRRVALGLLLVSLGLAGFWAASVVAGTRPPVSSTESTGSSDTTETTTTETVPETTTETTTTTVPPPKPRPKPRPKARPKPVRIAPHVTVGGVHVGGLTRDAAYGAVRLAFSSPLVLLVQGKRLSVSPGRLGARAYVEGAVRRATHAAPGSRVALVVRISGGAVRAYVRSLARRLDRTPRDARVLLRASRPRVTGDRMGFSVRRLQTVGLIVRALRQNRRGPFHVPARTPRPQVSSDDFGPIVVVRRQSKWLFLYDGEKFVRRVRVATGQAVYPTPLGRFEIIAKWRNPWWYPPSSAWARGLNPVPPGPGNPLGTRWMGISAPGVGIHGTPDAASLGYSASHGCIRMAIPSAEWLFDHVEVGTLVFIVSA